MFWLKLFVDLPTLFLGSQKYQKKKKNKRTKLIWHRHFKKKRQINFYMLAMIHFYKEDNDRMYLGDSELFI